jgi:hypothetical protein
VSRAALAVTLLAAVTLSGSTSISTSRATAAPAVRIIDRTLACTTGAQGGARVVFLRAQSAYGQGATLEWLAQATVATPGQPNPSKPDYRPTLAGVTAGWPPPKPLTSGGLGFEGRRCKATRARVAFSRQGLTGGRAAQLGDEIQCVVPRSLLIRVRAVFREPVGLEVVQRSYSAVGRIEQGQVAVRTTDGKPLVYADVSDSGRARLFTAKGCV